MFDTSFAFNSAGYLVLLALLPAIWFLSFRSLAGLGSWRRVIAIGLRSLVIALIVFALADMQYQKSSDRLTVIYLLDQSLSIPEGRRSAMIRYVNASIRTHRDDDKEDRAGVIVFGENAEVEVPPVDFDIQIAPRVESLLNPQYTNLAGALQRAMAMFPYDAAKRIVVVTDGNENIGDALKQARAIADAGISIDVMPVPLDSRSEVSVEKVTLPTEVRRNQPFEVRTVVNNDSPAGDTVNGRLRIVRKAGQQQTILADAPVELPPGKSVFPLLEEIEESDFYSYEARFIPDDPAADNMQQNNSSTNFTHIRGKGQVLLIEDWEHPGEFDTLVSRLKGEGLEVTVQPSDQLFTSLPELQRYDSVILANVPRSSGFDANNVSSFSDAQIRMLARNTEELGCGLIMLGGANSFGAGGWTNTEIEKAMPVDFTIKSAKVIPVGALVLNMHAGEIPRANYWQKVIAAEAIRALGPRDYCGLVQWNGNDQWLWGRTKGGLLRVGDNQQLMLASIDKMNIGDMPQFDGSMKMAAAAFTKVTDAAIKHMIIISDGDPSPPMPGTIAALKKQGVKVTTVLVGDPRHAPGGQKLMNDIAVQTGGKAYVVKDARALPRIYQREARKIARPVVYEPKPAVSPQITTQHEMMEGIGTALPPIRGLVLTTIKDSPLVEVILTSPKPVNQENATVLAAWPYGLGKSVAFTTDAGERWADQWTGWGQYAQFFSQMVRWSMRPSGDTGKFTVASEIVDGRTRVVITALDKDDEFLNFQSMTGTTIGPDMNSQPLSISQTAPGRYVGKFESTDVGSYLIMISPGAGQGMIRTGVNVGYSEEFRRRETNLALLTSIAELPAKDGEPGTLIEPLPLVPRQGETDALSKQLEVDPYRRDLPPALASRDIWPLLVLLGSCVFLADVFVRRVHVGFEWLFPLLATIRDKVFGRQQQTAKQETMSRLRSRKVEVGEQIESRRATTRYESPTDPTVEPPVEQATSKPPASYTPQTPKQTLAEESSPEEDSYTSRLLKAKKQVWKDRDK